MTLCNPKHWLKCAQSDRRAIDAFNANTLAQIQAIVLAAQAEDAPAFVQISHRALQYLGGGLYPHDRYHQELHVGYLLSGDKLH